MPTAAVGSDKKPARKFIAFWLFLVLFKWGAGLHYTLIAPLGEHLYSLWAVGLLMAISSAVQVVLDVPAGHLLDRYGYKKILVITAAIFAFAAISFFFGLNRLTFLISIFFSTFGWLFFGPGINAYTLSHAPKSSAGRFISLRDISTSLGIVLASSILPFVLLLPVTYMGLIMAVLLGLALLAIATSPHDVARVTEEIKLPTQHHYIRRDYLSKTLKAIKQLNPASTMLILLNMAGATFYGVVWFVVPLVIAHQATGSGLLGVGLGMFDFSIVVLGFLLGNLADRANRRTLVFLGLLTFAVAGMLLGFNFGWLFLLFGFLATSGDEMASISLWSWLNALDRFHNQDGAISGIIVLFEDIGWTIGPLIAGILFTILGPTWTIVWGALPIALTWVIYRFLMRYHNTPSELHLRAAPPKPHRARHKN